MFEQPIGLDGGNHRHNSSERGRRAIVPAGRLREALGDVITCQDSAERHALGQRVGEHDEFGAAGPTRARYPGTAAPEGLVLANNQKTPVARRLAEYRIHLADGVGDRSGEPAREEGCRFGVRRRGKRSISRYQRRENAQSGIGVDGDFSRPVMAQKRGRGRCQRIEVETAGGKLDGASLGIDQPLEFLSGILPKARARSVGRPMGLGKRRQPRLSACGLINPCCIVSDRKQNRAGPAGVSTEGCGDRTT
jgi:hypothetical protein